MNKFILGTLAATLVSTSAFATESDWSGLDREIEALSSTLAPAEGGAKVSGWIHVRWDSSSDFLIGTEDQSGAAFTSIRLNFTGSVADYGYKVSADLASGTAMLRDAFVDWKFTDNLKGRIGQFKMPFLRSGLCGVTTRLFVRPTNIAVTTRDAGLMVSGNFDMLSFAAAVQNGTDGQADEYRTTFRVAADLMGEGAGIKCEGAYGASEGMNVSAAVAFTDDGGVAAPADEVTRTAFEVYMTNGPWAAAAEMVDNDTNIGDNSPWDATVSFMFNDDYEAAVRWEDRDDAGDTTDLTVGINKYLSGHSLKWMLNYRATDSDMVALDGDEISLALVLGF